jgi:chromosome segregation ATPase
VTITLQERDAIHNQLLSAAARVQQLERRLALREQEITTALTEIDELRTAVERTDLSGLGLSSGYSGQRPSPSPGEAPEYEPQHDAPHGEASAMQLAELKRQLDEERKKRTQLERDLENLKVETSSGPFESRIQKDLNDARDQIERLQAALQVERQARERIAREYNEVKSRAPASGETGTSAEENLAAIQANQERLLATMRRQLEESERREKDLRDGLTAMQGEDGVDLAITVADLEAENSALQTRLDNEHVRNEGLAAKLRAAMRAADLIFRMNSDREAAPLP